MGIHGTLAGLLLLTGVLGAAPGGAAAANRSAAPPDGIRYVSPRPGARFVAPGSAILLRTEAAGSGAFPVLDVRGEQSGIHRGRWTVAGETLVFRPDEPFQPGEEVRVEGTLPDGRPFSYGFTVSGTVTGPGTWLADPDHARCRARGPDPVPTSAPAPPPHDRGPSLPMGFPTFTVTVHEDPAPGLLFMAPRSVSGAPPHFSGMFDSRGRVEFFRRFPTRASDFKRQKHVDLYTYFRANRFEVADPGFEVIDIYGPENGYWAMDGHDFQILPGGNALVGIQDYQIVDMSQIVPGGDPAANVLGFVLQEQDPSHNVVFQWRSWDHFEITDAQGIDLTAPLIDYVHFNSFDLDTDGDILLSFRETNEMTKISRQTGEVLWRLGGSQNEFTLVGDTRWFERQHSIRRTPTGTVTVFDNGSMAEPFESRAVEYEIDEPGRIATMVWEFKDDRYAPYGGNVQRLPGGHTLIDWAPEGIVTEARPDGTKAWELVFDTHWTYRAFRQDWSGVATRPELWHEETPQEVTLHFEKFGDAHVGGFRIYRGASPEPTTQVGFTTGRRFVLDVDPLEILHVRVTAVDSTGTGESPFSNELRIEVPGTGASPVARHPVLPVASGGAYPNPFAGATEITFELPQAGRVRLSVFDVQGRLVRTLADGPAASGRSVVRWDGRDASGRPAGTGVYFYRLRTESDERTGRLVRVR